MLITLSNDGSLNRTAENTYKLIENLIIPINFPLIVDFERPEHHEKKYIWVGLYDGLKNIIYIDKAYWLSKLDNESIKEAIHLLCHEIGHAIHFNYLANKPQYLRRKDPNITWLHYNKNGAENFAECFADYCMAVFEGRLDEILDSKRLSRMQEILKDIKSNACQVVTYNDSGSFYMDNHSWRRSNLMTNISYISRDVTYPFTEHLKTIRKDTILKSHISDIYMPYGVDKRCIKAGWSHVADILDPSISEEEKIKKLGKRNLKDIYDSLQNLDIDVEDYVMRQ